MKLLKHFKVVASTAAVVIVTISFSSLSFAGDITEYANSEWLQAGYDTATGSAEVLGATPADPDGVPCGDTDNALSADKPPWTFTVGPGGAVLTVVDNWTLQDQYAVFDNGNHIGDTSEPPVGLVCYDIPDFCLEYGSKGEFELGEGDHSITMTAIGDYVWASCLFFRLDGDVGGPAMEVGIDIQPNKVTNKVRLEETATIPVAILSHADFDARLVDQYTVKFGSDGALPVERMTRFKDVNRDGYKDILFRFNAVETGIQCGDTEASLTAEWEGQNIVGTDSFTISPSSCR